MAHFIPHVMSSITSSILTEMKRNPCTDLDSPLGLQNFEVPRITRQSTHDGVKLFSPTHRPPLLIRRYIWWSFLLKAESNPGPQCGEKGLNQFNDHIGNRTCHLPSCSAVSQPTAPPPSPLFYQNNTNSRKHVENKRVGQRLYTKIRFE